jgi:hypothetical protein
VNSQVFSAQGTIYPAVIAAAIREIAIREIAIREIAIRGVKINNTYCRLRSSSVENSKLPGNL